MFGGKKLRSILLLLLSSSSSPPPHLHVGPSDLFPSSFKLKFFMHSHLSLHAICPIPPPLLIF